MTVLEAALGLGLPSSLARAVAGNAPLVELRGRPLAAVDLDRTLIYSTSALGLEKGDDGPRLTVAELRDGQPLSYCTRGADQLIDALDRAVPFVPVTTRTVAQFRRVRLTDRPARYAVAANGGQILADGRPDVEWARHIADRAGSACAPLGQVRAHLAAIADKSWLLRVHTADDLFCYAIVERARLPTGLLADLAGWSAAHGWTVSVQGRKLYCLPRPLTKKAAVDEIARRLGCGLVLAAGDSLLDRALLAAADVGIRPAHGELHERGWRSARVAVTSTAGVRAGEEVAAYLLGYALSARPGFPLNHR